MPRLSEPSPYVEFDRSQWRALRMSTPMKLTEDEVLQLRGLGEKLDLLARLLLEEETMTVERFLEIFDGEKAKEREAKKKEKMEVPEETEETVQE